MWKKLLVASFFLITCSSLKAQEIKWISFEEAMALNKETPKLILIDIYTDWCGWCKKLEQTTYKNTEIIKLINTHYYAVKLDGEGTEPIVFKNYTFKYKEQGNTKYHEFAATLMDGKLSYPTTIIMDNKETVLDKIPGYLDPKLMEKVLHFFSSEKFKTTNWNDFEKEFKSNIKT